MSRHKRFDIPFFGYFHSKVHPLLDKRIVSKTKEHKYKSFLLASPYEKKHIKICSYVLLSYKNALP